MMSKIIFIKKKYYFNIFLNKKYFKKTKIIYSNTARGGEARLESAAISGFKS